MSACATCQKPIENEAFSGILCQSCYAEEQKKSDASSGGMLSKIPLAVLVAAIPFVVSFRSTSTSSQTVNGEVVEQSVRSMDYVALALGPAAILLGIVAILGALKGPAAARPRALAFAALGILLGAYQIYRGLT